MVGKLVESAAMEKVLAVTAMFC